MVAGPTGDRTISMGLVRKLRLLTPGMVPLRSFLTLPALTMTVAHGLALGPVVAG